jgi:DNA (cytosine-5)-methyltransferase 1
VTYTLHNHYGYGLRNDEVPFAHKIPPGGNWKCLDRDDQIAFMKGAINSGGGQTTFLRRMRWDEPSLTIVASPMAKATCYLHPGEKYWEVSESHNHVYPDNISEKTFEHNRRNQEKGNGFKLVPQQWDKPSGTIDSHTGRGSSANIYPTEPKGDDVLLSNIKPLLDSLPKLPPNGLTSIELFAGGGLMRLGIEHAGITTIWANDFDKNACRAHEYNFGEGSIVHGDINAISIDDIPDSDLIIGGPPCQDFSVAGKGEGENGERGKLVWRYLEIIAAKQPKAFLFENVKGLISKRHRHTFDALLERFDQIGYNVSWKLINAWDYGVAQKRERVFIVGIRKDLNRTYIFPPSEYELTGYHPVLRDAIGDLPEPNNSKNHQDEELPRYVQNILDGKSKTNFGKMPITDGSEPARTMLATYGDKKPTELYCPNNHTERDYWTPKSEYTYDQANRVQSMDAPSNTIPAHHNSGQPIHPTAAPRRFTVRECLRIQSVPDTYVFPDDMSLSAMYRVVGNGVPSRVAYHLAVALSDLLLNE